MLQIPDVSEAQGSIAHSTVVNYLRRTYGGAVVISRLCYGDVHVDDRADRNIDGFREWSTDPLGWYLYLIAGRDPAAQADTFARVLNAHGGLRAGEFVVVDDEESTGGDESGRVDAALGELDRRLKTPNPTGEDWWYSGLAYAKLHDLEAARGHRWIAAYQAGEPTAIPHDLWQRTDAATMPGITGPVDCSVFNGTIAEFTALIGASAAANTEASMYHFTIDVPGAPGQQHMAGVNVQGVLRHVYDANTPGLEWVENDPGVTGLGAYAPCTWDVSNGQLHLTTSDKSGQIVHCYQQLGQGKWVVERV
jgi:Glycosyl hydrolases family 25